MDITENEILDRWNDSMKRAVSAAREMVEYSGLSDKKRSMWNAVASGLEELRRRGNILAQGIALSRQQVEGHLDAWQARIGHQTDLNVAAAQKKRLIIDA